VLPVKTGKKFEVTIGPPKLTKFERARILGARALMLSNGAPPFIDYISKFRSSLDIAQEELRSKALPISVRRVLPSGIYQDIPLDYLL